MRVEIYTRSNCTYCTQAKALLKSKGQEYNEYDVNNFEIKESLFDRIPQNWKTLPCIFIDDKFVGGFTELLEWYKKEDNVKS